MKKLFILLIVMISLLFVCFFTSGLAQSELERIVKKDCYGAFNREDMDKMTSVIMAKDETAFKGLIIEGKIFLVKKGTKVFIEDTAFWSGCAKVRPEGQTRSIWLFFEDLAKPESVINEIQKDTITKELNHYKIEGIFYDKVKPAVMVGGKIRFVNDSVCGGKITNISPDEVTINFENIEKEYKVGDLITGEIESVSEYLKRVDSVINSLKANDKEIGILVTQAKTAGNIGAIIALLPKMVEFIKQHKEQLSDISVPLRCKRLHSLILEWLQLQEDIVIKYTKGSLEQAMYFYNQAQGSLEKLNQEIIKELDYLKSGFIKK